MHLCLFESFTIVCKTMHNEHKTVTLIGLLIDTGATAAHDAAAAGNVDTCVN